MEKCVFSLEDFLRKKRKKKTLWELIIKSKQGSLLIWVEKTGNGEKDHLKWAEK